MLQRIFGCMMILRQTLPQTLLMTMVLCPQMTKIAGIFHLMRKRRHSLKHEVRATRIALMVTAMVSRVNSCAKRTDQNSKSFHTKVVSQFEFLRELASVSSASSCHPLASFK
jgi:hypothetical protein